MSCIRSCPRGGADSDQPNLSSEDFETGCESLDDLRAEFRPDADPATITDFIGADDVLVLYYDDATDPGVSVSFTDNGGTGVTEVSLFGKVSARLIGNVDDIGLTADNIATVNVALD